MKRKNMSELDKFIYMILRRCIQIVNSNEVAQKEEWINYLEQARRYDCCDVHSFCDVSGNLLFIESFERTVREDIRIYDVGLSRKTTLRRRLRRCIASFFWRFVSVERTEFSVGPVIDNKWSRFYYRHFSGACGIWVLPGKQMRLSTIYCDLPKRGNWYDMLSLLFKARLQISAHPLQTRPITDFHPFVVVSVILYDFLYSHFNYEPWFVDYNLTRKGGFNPRYVVMDGKDIGLD